MERLPEDPELERGEIPPMSSSMPARMPDWSPEGLKAASAEWLEKSADASRSIAPEKGPTGFLMGVLDHFGDLIDLDPPPLERRAGMPAATLEEDIQECWREVGKELLVACETRRNAAVGKPQDTA